MLNQNLSQLATLRRGRTGRFSSWDTSGRNGDAWNLHAPASYSELAEAPIQAWPFSAMLPGVLEHFDLPDVDRELARRGLEMRVP
jgi:hypothetical protein